MIPTFLACEEGAVTVDWVVLTAALVGLGLATMGVVSGGVNNVSTDIDGQLQADGIIKTSFVTPVSFFGVAGFTMLQDTTTTTTVGCYRDGNNQVQCVNGIKEWNRDYWLSDGTVITQNTYQDIIATHTDLGGGSGATSIAYEDTVTWYDADGVEIDPANLPELPAGLPFSADGPA